MNMVKQKYKSAVIKLLAVLNSVEGIIHIIVATIGTWGCLDLGIYDFRVLLPNIENYLFGIFSLLTGIIIVKLK